MLDATQLKEAHNFEKYRRDGAPEFELPPHLVYRRNGLTGEVEGGRRTYPFHAFIVVYAHHRPTAQSHDHEHREQFLIPDIHDADFRLGWTVGSFDNGGEIEPL